MKLQLFSIAILFSSIFYSCKKETPNFTIKGTITDNGFSIGLNEAKIDLYEVEIGTTSPKLVSSTNSDNNGSYNFNFQRNKIEKYIIKISKINYFDIEDEIQFSSLATNEDNIKNYSIDSKSWVKLHFTNSDNDLSKSIEYGISEGKTDCNECCPASKRTISQIIDTNIFCINNGNSIYSILTITDTIQTFSINTIPFDTVEINIPF
jgi:hypothetical protein